MPQVFGNDFLIHARSPSDGAGRPPLESEQPGSAGTEVIQR